MRLAAKELDHRLLELRRRPAVRARPRPARRARASDTLAAFSIVSTRSCRKKTWPPRASSRSTPPFTRSLVVLAHVGVNRPPFPRAGLDHGDVAQAASHICEVPGSGSRSERTSTSDELAQKLLLPDAEALLLVDDHSPRSFGWTSRDSSRWVPIRMSTFLAEVARGPPAAPSAAEAGTARFGTDSRERSRNVPRAARRGSSSAPGTATCLPSSAALKPRAAPPRLAVADVPADQPFHRLVDSMSALVCSIASSWSSVSR